MRLFVILVLFTACALPRGPVANLKREQRAANILAKSDIVAKTALPVVPLNITPEVRREIARFTNSNRKSIERALENPYNELMKEVFRDEGIPEELINVALLESQFNPNARSPMGAKGIWQFMPSTGRLYGLKVGGGKDERTDPILSTIAAAKHLKDLYAKFGDWHLALAGYNAGPYRVSKAMKNTNATGFWELSRKGAIPKETSMFVPKFIASTIILQHPKRFGFDG